MAKIFEEPKEETEQKQKMSHLIMVALDKESSCRANRSVTDGYWCFLFIFIFVIWSASWYYATYYHQPYSTINSDNITVTKIRLTQYYFWGKSWFLDTITCNVAFISTHYESNGSIAVGANILIFIGLFLYSTSLMRNDMYYMFHSQLDAVLFSLICFTLIFRLLTFNLYHFKSPSIMDSLILPSHEKLLFWLMPELIFVMIWYTKKRYNDDHIPLQSKDMRTFYAFKWVMLLFVAVSLAILCSLYLYTMDITYKLSWKNRLSYVIVGGSFYIGLTVFYFMSIVISCAVYNAVDKIAVQDDESSEDRPLNYREFFEAFILVSRYHFGTACYHATLIFPRIHSFFVMNEPEFKELQFTKITHRIYAAHCKLHHLTPMLTAVGGTNHADSLRELLRHFVTDLPPKVEYFHTFSQITRASLALLMSTNNLTLITLWYYGLDDPRLSLATWAFYLRLMIISSIPMKFCDMASDTIWLIKRATFNFFEDLLSAGAGDENGEGGDEGESEDEIEEENEI